MEKRPRFFVLKKIILEDETILCPAKKSIKFSIPDHVKMVFA